MLSTPHGAVRANKVVLATDAFAGESDITPRNLSVPIWIIEAETEPIDDERGGCAQLDRSVRVVTQPTITENYRLTPRNTIAFGVRRLERGTKFPLPAKAPDPGMVNELANGSWSQMTDVLQHTAASVGDQQLRFGEGGLGVGELPETGAGLITR
ncbi:hypothetical protein [Streptomyces sp. NPDC004266]|uniref:hypothetical protein n=1 Tax=Streptomyces sp. NPDC004266 TaxID=3364693 RepID=UPI0036789D45